MRVHAIRRIRRPNGGCRLHSVAAASVDDNWPTSVNPPRFRRCSGCTGAPCVLSSLRARTKRRPSPANARMHSPPAGSHREQATGRVAHARNAVPTPGISVGRQGVRQRQRGSASRVAQVIARRREPGALRDHVPRQSWASPSGNNHSVPARRFRDFAACLAQVGTESRCVRLSQPDTSAPPARVPMLLCAGGTDPANGWQCRGALRRAASRTAIARRPTPANTAHRA